MSDAGELHAELRALETRKPELERQSAALRTANARRRERLGLLDRDNPARSKTRGRVFIWGLVLAGIGIYATVKTIDEKLEKRPQVRLVPAKPHLLITSEPAGARVSFAGARPQLPQGQRLTTPLAFEAPARSRYVVTVAADGHAPQTRGLATTAEAGEHWHVKLVPRAADTAP